MSVNRSREARQENIAILTLSAAAPISWVGETARALTTGVFRSAVLLFSLGACVVLSRPG